jgi:hypothetical protein
VFLSDRLNEVAEVVREVLFTADSPRQIAALAPVLVRNVDRVSLSKLRAQFIEAGLLRRLDWFIENTLEAVKQELTQPLPRNWTQLYRRAEVVLSALPTLELVSRGGVAGVPDVLDPNILSKKTLEEVNSKRSAISKRWGIATDLQPEDFVEALRASRAANQ